jgi:hypothetical protein
VFCQKALFTSSRWGFTFLNATAAKAAVPALTINRLWSTLAPSRSPTKSRGSDLGKHVLSWNVLQTEGCELGNGHRSRTRGVLRLGRWLNRTAASHMQAADHCDRQPAFSTQNLRNPGARTDDFFQISARERLLLHAELDRLWDRVGPLDDAPSRTHQSASPEHPGDRRLAFRPSHPKALDLF